MRNLIRNGVIILAAILIAIWGVSPPAEKLRFGMDLSGGVTLLYPVQIERGEDPDAVFAGMIQVLKDRIDPEGKLGITMVQQGRDRLEVTMPLPTEEVKRLKAAFERELHTLEDTPLTGDILDLAVRLPAEQREAEFTRLAGTDVAGPLVEQRLELLGAAAAAYDASEAARRRFDEARAQGVPREIEDSLIEAAGAAREAYEVARATALASVIRMEDVRRALELDTRNRFLPGEKGEPPVRLPSPREKALERVYAGRRDAPDAASRIIVEQLDRVVAAYDEYKSKRKTLDDPSDLKRLLRGAGVLSFRICVDSGTHPDEQSLRRQLRENGPRAVKYTDSTQARWYKINKIDTWYDDADSMRRLFADPASYFVRYGGYVVEPYLEEFYMLCWDAPGSRLTQDETRWKVVGARQGQDELGRASIVFNMDAAGGRALGEMTGAHVGDQMAVLLDDQVYTAPNLNERIARSAMISGEFTGEEIAYIVRVLSAGALAGKLAPDPIAENTIAPEFGKDNLDAGLRAGMLSFILGAILVTGYYFFCGGIAVVALLVNALLLVGIMAIGRAPFTLPGIAGIILTFGMAVDANVLIYERMREELVKGADLRTAVRLGYSRAMSSIVDGNLTNLITCVVLYYVGTPEIRGFALTMSIGVLTTLFTQLFITRNVFDFGIDVLGWRRTTMLPLAMPAITRALTPRTDWMGIRRVGYTISTVLFIGSLVLIGTRGAKMLDTEFRGGTSVDLTLVQNPDGTRRTLKREDVASALRQVVAEDADPSVRDLRQADVIVVDPAPDGITSSKFKIKSLATNAELVRDAIARALAGDLDSKAGLRFQGSAELEPARAPIHRIVREQLGANIGRPEIPNSVPAFVGGLAIVLEGIDPPASLADTQERIADLRDRLRTQPEFAASASRVEQVVPITGNEEAMSSAVILVRDPDVPGPSEDEWLAMREQEWRLIRTALTETQTNLTIEAFSPAVARVFVARAIVAAAISTLLVVVYIWVRFASLRFSMAAIITTLHDCIIAVGFIALAEVICEAAPGLAAAIRLQPFRMDLNVVAAVLTILGYSLNDTIVVMDRIRENRGKLTYVDRQTANDSITQTLSRTLLTGGTTMVSVIVLYLVGGEAVRAFAYTLGVGIIVGTYSSIAVAATLVWDRSHDRKPPTLGPDSIAAA